MRGHWIAVAAAAHVRRGLAGGFMQVCHGKAGPLKRIKAGDGVMYYSPTETFGGHDRLQAFTAIGVVRAGDPYQVDMGGGFRPYRKNVAWMESEPAAIKSLLDALDFASGKSNWGYQLRYGLLAISAHDLRLIAAAMGATIDAIAA